MKKTDVKRSYHNGTRGLPMVNVKVYITYDLERVARQHAEEFPDALFPTWLATISDAQQNDAWECAIEDGWRQLEDDAVNVFGGVAPKAKVYSAGRSGGWCVVAGLPDVDTWNAIMVGKWAQFARWARQTADDIPYRMVDYLYHNPFAQYRERLDAKMTVCANDAGVVG